MHIKASSCERGLRENWLVHIERPNNSIGILIYSGWMHNQKKRCRRVQGGNILDLLDVKPMSWEGLSSIMINHEVSHYLSLHSFSSASCVFFLLKIQKSTHISLYLPSIVGQRHGETGTARNRSLAHAGFRVSCLTDCSAACLLVATVQSNNYCVWHSVFLEDFLNVPVMF